MWKNCTWARNRLIPKWTAHRALREYSSSLPALRVYIEAVLLGERITEKVLDLQSSYFS